MFVGEETHSAGICKEKKNNHNMARRIGNHKNATESYCMEFMVLGGGGSWGFAYNVSHEEYNILGTDAR